MRTQIFDSGVKLWLSAKDTYTLGNPAVRCLAV